MINPLQVPHIAGFLGLSSALTNCWSFLPNSFCPKILPIVVLSPENKLFLLQQNYVPFTTTREYFFEMEFVLSEHKRWYLWKQAITLDISALVLSNFEPLLRYTFLITFITSLHELVSLSRTLESIHDRQKANRFMLLIRFILRKKSSRRRTDCRSRIAQFK